MTLFWPLLVIIHQSSQKSLRWQLCATTSGKHRALGRWLTRLQRHVLDQEAGCNPGTCSGDQCSPGNPPSTRHAPRQAWREKSEVWWLPTRLCKEHGDKRSNSQQPTPRNSPWSYKKRGEGLIIVWVSTILFFRVAESQRQHWRAMCWRRKDDRGT